MGLLPIVAGGPGQQFQDTLDKRAHPLGSMMMFADGRRFAYSGITATDIAAGALCQQTLNAADHDLLAVAAAVAIGDKVVTVTNGGSTAIGVDDLADGYIVVEDDAGEGHLYTIRSNDAAATSATVTLTLYDPIQVALTTATTVTLFRNPWGRAIIHPSPATALLLGVTPAARSNEFGWLQTWGPAACITQGTLVINEKVIDSASADGAVAPTASTAAGEEYYVGVTMEVGPTTEHSLIHLRMS